MLRVLPLYVSFRFLPQGTGRHSKHVPNSSWDIGNYPYILYSAPLLYVHARKLQHGKEKTPLW